MEEAKIFGMKMSSAVTILCILVVLLIILIIFIIHKMNVMARKYEMLMSGKKGADLEKIIRIRFKEMDQVKVNARRVTKEHRQIKKHLSSCISKYALVKYDAFDKMAGKLSFVIALLNDENSGILLNSMHSREGCFTYAKEIVNGESYIQLSSEEKEALEAELEKQTKKAQREIRRKNLSVTEDDVADVVSGWTKIPVKKLAEGEAARLKKLEATLHKRVVGQEEAVTAVAKAVRRGRVGLKDPRRPIGSFLFLGPTGVGKTEISKALAEAVFGNEQAMIRVDMSEYMEKHSVSKMIGSPPGYVGHEDGGQLSEKVRRNPYSVILFDEIEKAHPDVFNILLQVLDDGHITDSQGRKVDFKNTIIIMTSNAGAQSIVEPKKLGFASSDDEKQNYERMKNSVMEEVRRIFKPEFLNRIDETIVFRSLNKNDMKQIVTLMLKDLTDRCKSQMDITLHVRDSVKNYIVEKAYEPKYGARPLRRKIQNEIEDQLAEEILDGKVKKGDEVIVTTKKNAVVFEVKEQ